MKRKDRATRGVVILSCLATSFLFLGYDARIASAQVLYGSIVGTVTDPANAVVPNATVTVTHALTGLSRQASTDGAGYYSIPNLPQGAYDLSVTVSGFKPLTQKGVNVLINNVTRMDLSLEVGAVTESVTVEASAALLQTTKTDVNVNLEARAVGDLPLSGYRNFQSLINLVPGATPGRFQNAVIDTPQRDFTFNFNGQDRGDNNTRVDGAPNILVTMPHHMVYVPPVESIEEVNISTNNFEAEQG
ncbi:MAG: carboxypeptidase regulatory-like domain-containing protein, partial [Acidobacteria bacterium]|nr:carboxypeptidase regulatory-like domain-containing protein [Acidobacteriota bacterium]